MVIAKKQRQAGTTEEREEVEKSKKEREEIALTWSWS
jgi:hypothetical protein